MEERYKPAMDLERIRARIQQVRKAALGQHVMTLSNGQVWIENEPGQRPIEPDQEVTITRHRWNFEMEFKSRPNVAVHRIE